MIRKKLYGIFSSSERFREHLADILRSFGFFRILSIMMFELDLTNMETTTSISAHMLMTL